MLLSEFKWKRFGQNQKPHPNESGTEFVSRRFHCIAMVGTLGMLLHLTACTRAAESPPELKPSMVDTTVVRVQAVPVVLQAVGQIVPEHAVQVRAQVTGMLTKVSFTEGQAVSAGQHLFHIEPAPFEAAMRSAKAAWENAKGNADRVAPMQEKGYVSQQDYRNVRSAAEQAAAAYTQAQINLSYTDIHAAISGRTGSLTVKSGNVVSPSDVAPLVTINQMKPIQVQFNIPQQFLPRLRRYRAEGSIKVTISSDDGSGVLDTGKLVFIDNAVNSSAGTVMLKAQCSNDDEQLWPGQYVGVTLQLTSEPHAVVVDDTAIQMGQRGSFVYLVVDGKTQARDVTVDRQVGELAVVSSGLIGGEHVVSRVPRNLRSGMSVVSAATAPVPPAEVTLPASQ
jgi:membrane fusion protein, multidrug efflux system